MCWMEASQSLSLSSWPLRMNFHLVCQSSRLFCYRHHPSNDWWIPANMKPSPQSPAPWLTLSGPIKRQSTCYPGTAPCISHQPSSTIIPKYMLLMHLHGRNSNYPWEFETKVSVSQMAYAIEDMRTVRWCYPTCSSTDSIMSNKIYNWSEIVWSWESCESL